VTPEQALQLLDQAVAQLAVVRADHIKLQAALDVITRASQDLHKANKRIAELDKEVERLRDAADELEKKVERLAETADDARVPADAPLPDEEPQP
jgi:uncharacterized coiled-coil DUF342 family protein